MKAPSLLPTLPAFPAIDDLSCDRTALLAALAFIEGAAHWTQKDLSDWFCIYAGALGREGPPPSVLDSVVGTASLAADGPPSTQPGKLSRLLAMARWQVILTMRGLLSTPADDRFLNAAIFSQRARRVAGMWRASARDRDSMSDIVLSLFAVDVLAHREFHEQNLCICDVCGRISYSPRLTTRTGCSDHVPETEASSGVQTRSG